MSDSVERRDYQIDMKHGTYEAWQSGIKNVLNVLSTGGGKSVVMSDIVLDGAVQGVIQCVMAHRNELVAQMSEHIARREVPHRIVGSDETIRMIQRKHRSLFHGHQFVHPTARTSVVGVDTLNARADDMKKWAYQHDRWMMDEAHHTLRENKWGKAVAMMPNALGVGFTATPTRADGCGLGREFEGVFDVMHTGPAMRILINRGYLSDYEIVCPKSDLKVNDEDVSANGDWSNVTLRKASKESKIVGHVAENYCKHAFGRRAIVFATDVETATEICAKFTSWGIRAASLSAKTPATTRDKYIEEFKSGKISVLINVDLFDEGFDVPACDVVMMARPTASLGKYRQMVGRALRFQPGKIALIIDMVSNVVRHGLPDKEIIWTLERRDKRGKQAKDPDEVPLTTCVFCTKPYHKFMLACPHCGNEKPLPEPRDRTIEMVDGDYMKLDLVTLAKMRAATVLESAVDVAHRVGGAAGGAAASQAMKRQMEKIAAWKHLEETIDAWAGIQRAKGFSNREIEKKFYWAAGMDLLSAMDASRPASEMNSLNRTVQSWWRK